VSEQSRSAFGAAPPRVGQQRKTSPAPGLRDPSSGPPIDPEPKARCDACGALPLVRPFGGSAHTTFVFPPPQGTERQSHPSAADFKAVDLPEYFCHLQGGTGGGRGCPHVGFPLLYAHTRVATRAFLPSKLAVSSKTSAGREQRHLYVGRKADEVKAATGNGGKARSPAALLASAPKGRRNDEPPPGVTSRPSNGSGPAGTQGWNHIKECSAFGV